MIKSPLDNPEFEAELSRRTLISEQKRAMILAIVLCLVSLIIGIHSLTTGRKHDILPLYRGLAILMLCAAGYEAFVSRLFLQMVRKGRTPPRYRFYINAMVELAIPTGTAWAATNFIPAAHAITGLATYPYFLIILLSTLRLDFWLCLFTGALASAGFTLLSVAHWTELESAWGGPLSGIHFGFFMRGLMYLIYGIVAAMVSGRLRGMMIETMSTMHERERVMHLFGQHLSPVVVNQLLAQPAGDASELRDVCIMVLDIRNFTTYSEDRPADEVVQYLNTLWGFMVRTVNEHEGFLNKFLGDGFLAVFGAPLSSGIDCKNAFAASRKILRELEELTASGKLPKTNVGIALHAGQAIVGIIGSEVKKEYTVIGDVVNVAFRIEALNKELGTTLLISEPVHRIAAVENAEPMRPIPIRGRHEPVQFFKVE